MEQLESKKNILLIGGTGGVSLWIAHYLLKGNYNVSVLIRSKEKLKRTFQHKVEEFKNVFVEDLVDTFNQYQIGQWKDDFNPFDKYLKGIDICIQGVGTSKMFNTQYTKTIDYEVNKLLIEAAQKEKIEKFILVTSMFVTRPSNKVALMLNSMLGDTLGWKLKAENLLRKSGLDYVIVRPGGLKGGKDVDHIETQDIIEQFPQIGQGDNISGRIQRSTVGKLIVDHCIVSDKLPKKVTFEVVAQKGTKNIFDWSTLQADDEFSICLADHKKSRKDFQSCCCKWVVGICVLIVSFVLVKKKFF